MKILAHSSISFFCPLLLFAALGALGPVGCSAPPAATGGGGGKSDSGGSSTAGGGHAGGRSMVSGGSLSGGTSGGGGRTAGGDAIGGGGSGAGGASSGGSGNGGSLASGGRAGGTSGGSSGGGQAAGGTPAAGSTSSGGSLASGGRTGAGGASSGGRSGTAGVGGTGVGGSGTGVAAGSGSAAGSGGGAAGASSGSGGADNGDCSITITSSSTSTAIATVGIVEWSTTFSNPSSAQIVYTLNNASSSILSQGGTAPVDLKKANYRTLLLGLKPSSTYTFHVEATSSGGSVCKSADKTLTTGALSGAPAVTRTATTPSAQAGGFIVTSTGMGSGGGMGGGGTGSGSNGAYIVDADGTVVWYAAGPTQCSRAHMDYEGVNMWMLSLNVQNGGGEMRFVSMDGLTTKTNLSGLSSSHHDFAVLPGKIAAMVWAASGTDPESNLVEMPSDGSGSPSTVFKIGSNLYAGGSSAFGGGSSNTYHCNYIIYHPADDSFTISDRNPNLVVKVKHDGTPVWQIGGSCTNAKAPKCATGTWQVNHGHDLDGNGNMLLFNNGQSGASHVFEFKISETTSAISYSTSKDFTSSNSSNVLGDVQFLPNGNFLVTYSTSGIMLEVDSSWSTVQTLKASFGYADWRENLYGPPTRK